MLFSDGVGVVRMLRTAWTRIGLLKRYNGDSRDVDVPQLCTGWQHCQLCDLVRRTLKRINGNERDVEISRVGSALIMKHNGKRILRLCSDQGKYL